MQFSIIDKSLRIQSETPAEALEIIQHYRLDVLAHADALSSGLLTHVVDPSRQHNSRWFAVSHRVDAAWMFPYMARLSVLTGFHGQIPDIPAPRYPAGYCVNLCHTHIVESATVSGVSYFAQGFIESGDWNNQTAAARSSPSFVEQIIEDIGARKSEPEFIELRNGLLKKNPGYLRRHAPHPQLTSSILFGTLFQWWADNHATAGQRDILTRCEANHRTVCPRDPLASHLMRSYEPGFRVSWDAPAVSFTEFRSA